jgi:hypothetical protein
MRRRKRRRGLIPYLKRKKTSLKRRINRWFLRKAAEMEGRW